MHKTITICEYSCLSVFNINFEESTYNCQVWRETKVKENLCSLKNVAWTTSDTDVINLNLFAFSNLPSKFRSDVKNKFYVIFGTNVRFLI